MEKKAQLVEYRQFGDSRGKLVVIEGGETIPFEIKRIFYIYDTDKDSVRGQHANKRSEFVMINVKGSCKIQIIYKNGADEIFTLDRPDVGLYIPKNTWKNMYDFSEDSVLIVLSNEHYDENEYIKIMEQFKGE